MATILVVDDERPVREFLAQALEANGHQVFQAFHGRHALSLIARGGPKRPDLVLSDVMMPLVGGVELCQTLKADPATADIGVVLMSAVAPRVVDGAGADGFIRKPFDLDALDALLEGVLAAHPRRTP